MLQPLTMEVLQDQMAVSVARAVATANKKARDFGVDIAQSLISITQSTLDSDPIWRISYVPQDYVNRRGGDLIICVDMRNGTVKRVLQGQ